MKPTHPTRNLVFSALIFALAMAVAVFSFAAGKNATTVSGQDRSLLTTQEFADPNAPANLARIVASDAPVRVIVRLIEPPVAQYQGGISGLAPTMLKTGRHLDTKAASVLAYSNYLSARQDTVASAIQAKFTAAQVQYKYQLATNGFAAKVPGSAIPSIARMPGVLDVTVERRFDLDMDASLGVIGLYNGTIGSGTPTGLWATLGSAANAGAGVKIADIDSGIDQQNPFFDPTTFAYPAGFPKGDTAYTTPKVIAARAYFRPDDPPDLTAGECACPQDVYSGHGSHTAGTMAGMFNTPVSSKGVAISGVAPGAWLLNYKVFYHSISGSNSAYDPELLMALEDVIQDQADVVNNSWGGRAVAYAHDPLTQAYQAATDTGLVVVFSAGNNGPSQGSIGTPGAGERVITVGASTNGRLFSYRVDVVGGDASVTGIASLPGSGFPIPSAGVGPAAYTDAATLGNVLACSAFPGGSFTGKVALVKRGTCTFSTKINNAAAAGAIAVVVINNVSGPPASMSTPGTTIPSVMISLDNGPALQTWVAANPGAQIQIAGQPSAVYVPAWADKIASFSSRGPNSTMAIKPDLTAPGVDILSSYAPGSLSPYTPDFEVLQGTSMAAPHVTGMAALLHQLYPGWTPAMYKSALVNTTDEPASLNTACTGISNEPISIPQCRGAGRLSGKAAAGPGDPGIVLDPVSITTRAQIAGVGSVPETVTVTNVTAAQEIYSISIVPGAGNANLVITPSTTSLTVPANSTVTFDVDFNIGASTPPGDYWGHVNLDSANHHLHMMYWTRVVPAVSVTNTDLLLIDDDESLNGAPDYRSYYTSALDALGIQYDIFETSYNTCTSPWSVARFYKKVLIFSGDSNGFFYDCDWGIGTPNVTGGNLFFANGGRMLMTGQYAAPADYYGNGRNGSGASYPDDLGMYFGARVVQEDLYGGTVPSPTAQAMGDYNPFLGYAKIDLNQGAANQTMATELDARFYSDEDALPLFKAFSSSNLSSGVIGTRLSSEPTLERTAGEEAWSLIDYRGILLSFGLEAVDGATRQDLIGKLLNWLDDELTITQATLNTTQVQVNEVVKLDVQATSNIGAAISYYRVDWGDGFSPYTTSNPDLLQHLYRASGNYSIRVEAVDIYDHKAVWDDPITVTVVSSLFHDDFENADLATNWAYLKPSWSEANGTLIGTSAKTAIAIASPAFSGCSTCTIETTMETDGGLDNKVFLLGWYIDKNNTIEVMMKQESGKWILRQRLNGSITKKASGARTITPGTYYHVVLDYDGVVITLSVDGAAVATINPVGKISGTVGFQVKNTTGRIEDILVY